MYERQVQEREEKYEKLMGKFATSYASLDQQQANKANLH